MLSLTSTAVDFNNLQDSVNRYNNKIDQAPAVLKALMDNERLNMTILLNNGNVVVWGLETEKTKIVRYSLGGLENPTIEEYAAESAINEVLNAEDPVAVFNDAEIAGQIRVEGKTQTARKNIRDVLSDEEAIKYYFGMFI
jgi:cell division septal protein FtsQ